MKERLKYALMVLKQLGKWALLVLVLYIPSSIIACLTAGAVGVALLQCGLSMTIVTPIFYTVLAATLLYFMSVIDKYASKKYPMPK